MRTLFLAPILLLMAILSGCTQQPYVATQTIPPPIDPCSQMYFQEYACQIALNAGGYYHYGTWYPYANGYNRTIVIYRDNYSRWVNQGNRPTVIDFNAPEYTRSYRSPSRQSDTSQGSYRGDPSQPSVNTPTPATGSYRSEPASATKSGSTRELPPRDPVTGKFMKKESAPPSTSYRSQPPAAQVPASGSYRSTPAASPTRESGSYRSEPAKSTSYGSTRSTVTSGSTPSGSSRSTVSRPPSSSSTSSGSSRSTRSSSSSSRR